MGNPQVHPLSYWSAGMVEQELHPMRGHAKSCCKVCDLCRSEPLFCFSSTRLIGHRAEQVSHLGTSTLSMDLCPRLPVNGYFGQVREKLMVVVETRALSEVLHFNCVTPVDTSMWQCRSPSRLMLNLLLSKF